MLRAHFLNVFPLLLQALPFSVFPQYLKLRSAVTVECATSGKYDKPNTMHYFGLGVKLEIVPFTNMKA